MKKAKKILIDSPCNCGHVDSRHFCSERTHKLKGHRCGVTHRVFCDGESIIDPPWSCPCMKFVMNNLVYLAEIDRIKASL